MPLQNRPVPHLVHEMVGNIQEIIRSEVRLAVTEVREESAKVGRAATLLGAGVVLGAYALGLLLLAGVYGLATAMAPWLAALLLAVTLGIAAGAVIVTGKKHFRLVHVKPEKTISTMKENVQWVKHQGK